MEKLTNYDTFAIEQFSYFLSRLNETKDVNGKPLLGSTMALFGSGMSYGHSHGNANLPLVLAGGSDLGLKHGSHLDFNQGHFDGYQLDKPGEHYGLCSRPANPDAHMSNLLLSMAQRMGVETDTFGEFDHYPPVFFGITRGRHRRAPHLYLTVGVGDRAGFFRPCRGRQNHIGIVGRFG